MENRAKLLSFPRSLLSTLTSCRTQNLLSDVIHRQHHHQNPVFSISSPEIPFSSAASFEPLLPPSSPLRRPPNSSYPSLCRPRCPETFNEMVRDNCILSGERRKLSHRCPSPVSKGKKWRMKREKKNKKSEAFSSSYEDFFSSDDEREEEDDEHDVRETEALFSSSRSFLSLSSASSSSDGRAQIRSRRRRPPSAKRREARKKAVEEKVKGSFAVVKRSSDPYNDFRTSMVEMIMEKQIFGARELEKLLHCFLSLNPHHHHRIIVEVFAEICDTLFSDLC